MYIDRSICDLARKSRRGEKQRFFPFSDRRPDTDLQQRIPIAHVGKKKGGWPRWASFLLNASWDKERRECEGSSKLPRT